MMTLGQLSPELVKVLKLYQVPHLGKWSRNNRGFGNGGGSWNTARHNELIAIYRRIDD